MQEVEEAALAKESRQEAAREAAAAAAAAAEHIVKSPSDFSCHSYELFVGGEKGNDDNNKERMSIRSVESISEHRVKISSNNHNVTSTTTKVRKVSAVSASLRCVYRLCLSLCLSLSSLSHSFIIILRLFLLLGIVVYLLRNLYVLIVYMYFGVYMMCSAVVAAYLSYIYVW